jgi:hypothetical protein
MARIDSGKNQENNDGSWEKMYKDFFDKFDSVHKSTGEALGRVGENISKEAMNPFDYIKNAVEGIEKIGSAIKAVEWSLDQLKVKEYQDVLSQKGVTLRPASFYLGLISKESNFDQQAESNREGKKDKDGSVSQTRGLFQILVKTDSEGNTSSNVIDEVNQFYGLESKPEDVYFRGDDKDGREIAAQNNVLMGILFWHRCYDYGKNLKPDWSEDDKDKLANVIYKMGEGGVAEISRVMGIVDKNGKNYTAPKNFDELMRRLANRPVELNGEKISVERILEAMKYAEEVFNLSHVQPSITPSETPPKTPRVVPEPAPAPVRVEKNPEGVEFKETVAWNKDIIPTYDDGPKTGNGVVSDVTVDIMKASYERGVNNFEFYWLGANLLRTDVSREMGIGQKNDVPRLGNNVKPGEWMKWIEANKPAKMSRAEFIKSIIDPKVISLCQRMLAIKNPDTDLADMIAFHGITHEASAGGKHTSSLSEAQIRDELEFFQELIRAAFGVPDYMVAKGRTPYGAGLVFETDNAANKFQNRNGKISAAAKKVNPNFKWNAWHVDTFDWQNDGKFNSSAIARDAVEAVSVDKKRVLMHERFYEGGAKNVARLYDDLAKASEKPKKVEVGKRVELVEQLGQWTKEEINKMLVDAQKIKDPNRRMEFIVGKFMGTEFYYDSQLPILDKGKLRVRLETFDCVTFIYNMVAMSASKNYDEFVINYRNLRYKDPDKLGVDNDPENGNIFDFTEESVYENAIKKGYLRDVTREVAGAAPLTTVSTVLRPVSRDSHHDQKTHVVTPKVHMNEKFSVQTIDADVYSRIDKSKVKDGDVILFTRDSGQRVIFTHLAIAKKMANGEISFVHAGSSKEVMKVIFKNKRIDDYIKSVAKFKGFVVLRPQNLTT